jgi:hypothetical protein
MAAQKQQQQRSAAAEMLFSFLPLLFHIASPLPLSMLSILRLLLHPLKHIP